jgi:hypothetical protein
LGIALLGTYTLADPVAIPLDLDVHIALPIHLLAMTDRLQAKPVRLVFDWLSSLFSPSSKWLAPELNLHDLPKETFAATLDRVAVVPK